MTFIDIYPTAVTSGILLRVLIFIPFLIYAASLLIAYMYPLGSVTKNPILLIIAITITLIDGVLIFVLATGPELTFDASMGVPKNHITLIHILLILLLIASAPAVMLLKINRHSMNRIRNTVLYYIAGVLISYILFIAIYFSGYHFTGMTLLLNPFISIPVIYMLVITNYLLLDLRNNDFTRFYRGTLAIIITFTIYCVPIYFFLEYVSITGIQPLVALLVKSAAVFTWLVFSYRILNPLNKYLRYNNLNRLTNEIKNILISMHELQKITDMDKFWNFITRDNFQGLQKGFGIQSAYFMLINRKMKGYTSTYGFGPGIDPDFLKHDDPIITKLSAYNGIFEKSYLLTDTNLKGAEKEIDEFFSKNNLEAAIPFRNMSDTVIGFLFLGSISGKKGFNSDILEALEIFRIELQNILTTGLILDEVTADQVNDHDRIVVETIKKRILPDEMISIPGIRISSLYINNSYSGGDYIDAVKIGKDSSIIFMADTDYTGIDSALISLQLFSILHSRTMIFNSAEKVLNTMNQILKTSRISGNTVKSSCVIISSDGNFTYSSASFNPLIIYDSENGTSGTVNTSGLPLGSEMDYRYTLTSAKLREGSIGVIFSDGLLSSVNYSNETFSLEKIKETIVKFARQNPSIITREIYRELNRFTEGREQAKDISIIVFKKVKTTDD